MLDDERLTTHTGGEQEGIGSLRLLQLLLTGSDKFAVEIHLTPDDLIRDDRR